MIERIRRRNLNIKIVVVGEVSADWQVSLLQKGASQLLLPPTPWAALPELLFPNQTKTARTLKEKQPLTKPSPKVQAESLIDLLKYTNSADELSQALVQATKYALGINKTALFLVQGDILIPTHATGHLPQEIAPLSLETGLGLQIKQTGCILQNNQGLIHEQFNAVIPISSETSVIGALFVGEKITGGSPSIEELVQVFHQLQLFSRALSNVKAQAQVQRNYQILTQALQSISQAFFIIDASLKIQEANRQAKRHFAKKDERTGGMEYHNLDPIIASKIYQVLKTNAALEQFTYTTLTTNTAFTVSIAPITYKDQTSILVTAQEQTHPSPSPEALPA
jgi:PAS domain-containing protein